MNQTPPNTPPQMPPRRPQQQGSPNFYNQHGFQPGAPMMPNMPGNEVKKKNNMMMIITIVIGTAIVIFLAIIAYLLYAGKLGSNGNASESADNTRNVSSETMGSSTNHPSAQYTTVEPETQTQNEVSGNESSLMDQVNAKAKRAVPEYHSSDMGMWQNGANIFSGTFRFNGADYEFSLKVNYDAASGRITGAEYAPAYTGKFTKIKGSMSLTSDGSGLVIDGTGSDGGPTVFRVYGNPDTGVYSGDMTRNTHVGTCTLRL